MLEKQIVPVTFAAGVDTKTDENSGPQPSLSRIKNSLGAGTLKYQDFTSSGSFVSPADVGAVIVEAVCSLLSRRRMG